MKLAKNTYPDGHTAEDFKCFGPPATTDGEFDNVKIADLGCFTQEGKDTNKYYMACIAQSKINSKWYVYFEWGRVGHTPTFQIIECYSENEAQREFSKQLHSKNDKRGEWITVAGLKTLRAKKGKDCYLVRSLATRSTGLPDARTIRSGDVVVAKKSVSKKSLDILTLRLLKDLNMATLDYTKGSMADSSLPTQKAIDEARIILLEAQKRLVVVGDNIDDQLKDREIVQITNMIYGKIPKKKSLRAAPETWLLTKDNIFAWQQDLDAFESALTSTVDETSLEEDPFGGIPIHMEWIDPTTKLGKFIYGWWPKATANRHYGIDKLTVKNVWTVQRMDDIGNVAKYQNKILKESLSIRERPLHQPPERYDLTPEENSRYYDTNTALLLHGSRTVNIGNIIKTSFKFPKELVGVAITGAMFSGNNAIYYADDIKKSAGYTSYSGSYYARGSGGVSGRGAFMFCVNVVLGNVYVAPRSYPYLAPPDKKHAIMGKAGVSGVQNNEYIVFDKKQCEIKYLVEFN